MKPRLTAALLAGATACAAADTGVFYPVDPTTTFQHTCEDPAGLPLVIDLDAEGYAPGDTIRVTAVGDFACVPGGPEDGTGAIAVFSSDGVVDPDRSLEDRVPGAIQSDAPDFPTGAPLRCPGETTEIAEDFVCDGVEVMVPDRGDGRAAFLIVSALDEFYSDNVDPNQDFGVRLGRVSDFNIQAILTAEDGLYQPWDLAIGADGDLLIVNSRTAITPSSGPHGFLDRYDGSELVHLIDNLDGPSAVDVDADGLIYVGTEDTSPGLVRVYEPNGSWTGVSFTAVEVTGIAISEQFLGGQSIFGAARISPQFRPYGLLDFRDDSSVLFPVLDGKDEVWGIRAADFGPGAGSAFGADMIVTTFPDTQSPDAIFGVWRISPNGSADLLTSLSPAFPVFAGGIAVSPDPASPYGDYAYITLKDKLGRISADGDIEIIADGFQNLYGLEFDRDGQLYVSDISAAVIYAITPITCGQADLASPFNTLDLADITAFTSAFSAMDPIADLNPDGLFDLTDINLFVTSFLAGCP